MFSGLKRYKVVSISQHLFAIFLVLLTQCIRTHFSVVPSGHNRHHIEIYWYTLRTNKSGFLPVFGSSQAVFLFGLVGIVFSFKSWLRVNYDVMVVMIWRLKHCVNTGYINGSCCQPHNSLCQHLKHGPTVQYWYIGHQCKNSHPADGFNVLH